MVDGLWITDVVGRSNFDTVYTIVCHTQKFVNRIVQRTAGLRADGLVVPSFDEEDAGARVIGGRIRSARDELWEKEELFVVEDRAMLDRRFGCCGHSDGVHCHRAFW